MQADSTKIATKDTYMTGPGSPKIDISRLKTQLDAMAAQAVDLSPDASSQHLHNGLDTMLRNVVVREEPDGTINVAFMDPETVLKLVDKPEVHALGKEVLKLLQRVCASLKT
jgi:hypothetical protein